MLNSLNLLMKVKSMNKINRLKFSTLIITSLLVSCNQQNVEPEKEITTQLKKEISSEIIVQANLPKQYSIGQHAAAEVIAGWDIDIRPDGMGLPEGSGSVEDGEEIFEEKCAACHGSFGEGVDAWPKLAGGAETLEEARPEKTVGSFWPYASTLWDYINRAMPFPAPQSLEPDEVYALTAYVLSLNEIVDDEFVLTKENFATIQMPNKDGFYIDDRPDTNNTRCMKDCKSTEIKVILGPKYSLGAKEIKTEEPVAVLSEQQKTTIDTYNSVCKVCHANGIANAPKLGNIEDWAARITQNKEVIYNNAINGFNGMPAKGGRADLSDESVKAVVDYMLNTVK